MTGSIQLWLATAAVVLVSAVVQSMTGFGFAVLAVPLLALFWQPHDAVAVSFVLSTVCVLLLWPRVRHAERVPVVRPLFIAALVGLPLGVLALQRLDLHLFRLAIGTVTLGTVAVFALAGLRGDGGGPIAVPHRAFTLVTGFVAGVLTGALSMPGPPVVMLLTTSKTHKSGYRGTLTAFGALIYPVGLAVMFVLHLISSAALWQSILQAPVLVLGIALGHKLHDVASETVFSRLSLVLLGSAGVLCLIPR